MLSLLLVSTAIAYTSYQVIRNDTEIRQKELLNTLSKQKSDNFNMYLNQQLEQKVLLAEQIILLAELESRSYQGAVDRISQLLPSMQLGYGVQEIYLLSKSERFVTVEQLPLILPDEFFTKPKPMLQVVCQQNCSFVVTVPITLRQNIYGLSLVTEMSEAMINFARLSGTHVALLTQKSLPNNKTEGTPTYSIPITTAPPPLQEKVQSTLQTYSNKALPDEYFFLDDRQQDYLLWVVLLSSNNDSSIKVMFMEDLTSAIEHQQTLYYSALSFSIILIFSLMLAIVVLSVRPLNRLTSLSQAVKILGQKRYDLAVAELNRWKRQRFYQDEIHLVHNALLDTAISINQYENDLTTKNAELSYLASHDPLTGVLNRYAFDKNIAFFYHAAHQINISVILVRIKGLNSVSSHLGHETSDLLMAEVAMRLRSFTDKSVTLSRCSDEFILCFQALLTRSELSAKISNLFKSFHDPANIDGVEMPISINIGAATACNHEPEFSRLLSKAYIALETACENESREFCIYDTEMEFSSHRIFRIKTDFESGLDKGEFSVCYQPMLDFSDSKLVKMELLVRWNHAELGPIFPDVFIPVLEETGQIVPLTFWIIERALEMIKRLDSMTLNNVVLSVNVSGKQVADTDFIRKVADRFAKQNIDCNRLEFEITETSAVSSFNNAKTWVEYAHINGFKVAMDDFGTGFSSLSYLTSIPFDTIKLDRSLISNILTNPVQQQVVSAITTLIKRLGRQIVIEGVEEYNQFKMLKNFRCDIAQGYLVSRPLFEKQLLESLREYINREAWFS